MAIEKLKKNTAVIIPLIMFFIVCVLSAYILHNFKPVLKTEAVLLKQAKVFASGNLYAPAPPSYVRESTGGSPLFYIANNGKWYAHNDPGHTMMLTVGVTLGMPWLINPLMGALSLLFLFLISKELAGKKLAFIALYLAPFSPLFIFPFSTHMNHGSSTAFLLAFMYFFIKSDNKKTAFYAGLSLGMAVLCRPYTAFLFAFPFIALCIFKIFRKPSESVPFLFIALGACIGTGLLFMYYHTMNGSFLQASYSTTDKCFNIYPGFGHRGVNGEDFHHTPMVALEYFFTYMKVINNRLLVIPVSIPLFLIGAFLAKKSVKKQALILFTILSVVTGYCLFFWYDGYFGGARYLSSIMPLLLIFISAVILFGLDRLKEENDRFLSIISEKKALLVLAYIAFSLFVPFSLASMQLATRFNHNPMKPVELAEQQKLENAVVFMKEEEFKKIIRHVNGLQLKDNIIYAKKTNTETMLKVARYLKRENNMYLYDEKQDIITAFSGK